MADQTHGIDLLTRSGTPPQRRRGLSWIIPAIVIGVAVVVAAMLALGFGGRLGKPFAAIADLGTAAAATPPAVQDGVPVAMTADQLKNFASGASSPVYWAGPRDGVTYEVTRLGDSTVYVRYLPDGVKVGDKHADYLTVATYLQAGGYSALSKAADADGSTSQEMRSGALVVRRDAQPTSTWFSFPDTSFQVEVFDPKAGTSYDLVSNGDVAPLG